MLQQKPLIVIIYDGMQNSVFAGQVLQPLLDQRQQHPNIPIVLVSFESSTPTNYKQVQQKINKHDIQLILCKKIPLISSLSLQVVRYQLTKILKRYTQYELRARGPLAGYVCLHALTKHSCRKITIQARGLLAEEYAYAHRTCNPLFARLWHHWKLKLCKKIEQFVYGYTPANKSEETIFTIESVSNALKEYLINTYNTPAQYITIATHDIPSPLRWHNSVRGALRSGTLLASGRTHMSIVITVRQNHGNAQRMQYNFLKDSSTQNQTVSCWC